MELICRLSTNWHCLANKFRDFLLIGIVRTIDLGYCLLIGISHTIDLECGLLIGIVRTTDLGPCLIVGITRTIDLEGGLLIGIVRTLHLGDGLLIGIVRTIRFGDRPTNWFRRLPVILELSEQLTGHFQSIELVETIWPGGGLLS